MNRDDTNRRDVLKMIGAGIAAGAVFTGTASAQKQYGGGNGLGSFLNEAAHLKANPIWDGGIVDRTGLSKTEVVVGSTTSLDIPPEEFPPNLERPDDGPFGFAPRVVKVSPETTVKFLWSGNFFPVLDSTQPWPHDVVSLERDENGDHVFHSPFQRTGAWEHTFTEAGTHLYYCHPHGNPVRDHPTYDYNLMGMRGAVKVVEE
ncbi:twin-arginine translocation signal domain-containing protein [Haloarcula marina]|uniref:twin-arginine translocation signal domain-containing protein n=1 Tax=Haloarcula marina TaxID=2961574 RepID=UPI002114D16B|nr:twin-arginine translocation signal domain-containing protein [Halomicroarcula marina]